MANVLMSRFEPEEQNEAIKHLYMLIKEHRQRMIDDAEKKDFLVKKNISATVRLSSKRKVFLRLPITVCGLVVGFWLTECFKLPTN